MSKRKLIISVVFVFVMNVIPQLLTAEECGFVPSKDKLLRYSQTIKKLRINESNWSLSETTNEINYQVAVTFHVVRDGSGNGTITSTEVQTALDDLNSHFSQVEFVFIQIGSIDFIDDDYYHSGAGYVGGVNFISGSVNIYITPNMNFLICGNTSVNHILIREGCVTNGTTVAHEVGHYFNLLHTHHGANACPDGSNCGTTGDNLCDTPPDPQLKGKVDNFCVWNGDGNDPLPSGCVNVPYNPDLTNLMSYSNGLCRNSFSPGQIALMIDDLTTNLFNHIIPFPPKTLYVDASIGDDNNDGSEINPLLTINKAISMTNSGDEIIVKPGTYNESFVINGKDIQIKSSDGPRNTIITGGSSSDIVTFENNISTEALLQGFTLDGGERAIWCKNSAPTIKYNILINQTTTDKGAISLTGDSNSQLGDSPAHIQNNTILYCSNGGIFDLSNVAGVIKNNIISYCEYGVFKFPSIPDPNLSYNCLWQCNTDYINISNTGSNSINVHPMLAPDFSLLMDSPCEDAADPADAGLNPYGTYNNIGGVGDVLIPLGSCSPSEWDQMYGGVFDEKASSVDQTVDGGYVLVGTSASVASSGINTSVHMVKIDNCGIVQFEKTFEPGIDNIATDIEQTQDGGYIITGSYNNNSQFNRQWFLIKTDEFGNTIWEDIDGFLLGDDILYSVKQTDDLGFIAVGKYKFNSVSTNWEPVMIKLDKDGNRSWNETFDGSPIGILKDVVETEAGEFVAAGYGHFYLDPELTEIDFYSDIYVVKCSATGNQLWNKQIDGGIGSWDSAQAIIDVPDEGVIIAGFSNDAGLYSSGMIVTKLDYSGNEIWSRTYGGLISDIPTSITENGSGGFVIGVSSNSFYIQPNMDFLALNINSIGDVIWSKPFTNEGNDIASSIVRTYDGGFAIAGWTNNSNGSGGYDFRLVKFDDSSSAPILLNPVDRGTIADLSPTFSWNPVDNATQYHIEISDRSTPILFENPLRSQTTSSTSWTVSPNMPEGTYYWRVRTDYGIGYSYFSEIREVVLTNPPPPPPSCPVLFSYDGNKFVQNNTLLTECEQYGYKQSVVDFYHVTTPIQPDNSKIVFQIKEMEDEISYLNELELITVDHSSETNVFCSIDGKIIIYNESINPLTIIDQDGNNQLDKLLAADGKMFKAVGPGHLIVTFSNVSHDETGLYLTSVPKGNCGIIPLVKPVVEEDESQTNQVSIVEVEILDVNGDWIQFPNIPSRDIIQQMGVYTDYLQLNTLGELKYKISWNNGYEADVINQLFAAEEEHVIQKWSIDDITSSSLGNSAKILLDTSLDEPITLTKNEMIEFSFVCDKLTDQNIKRDYIIRVAGRYEPDYNVFGNLIPDDFNLYKNYPNPFNPTTNISYFIPKNTHIKLEIINLLGQSIKTLINDSQEAGHHNVVWDGKNNKGVEVSSGVYFYRISTELFTDTKKMMLLK